MSNFIESFCESATVIRNKPKPPKRKPKNKRPEDALQIQCVKLLRSLPGTLCFSVPNHIYINAKSDGARMAYFSRQKMMGMLPGVSDLVIMFRNTDGQLRVVLPELKSENGHMSEHQAAFAKAAQFLGAITGVVRSLSDLQSMLKLAGHPAFARQA